MRTDYYFHASKSDYISKSKKQLVKDSYEKSTNKSIDNIVDEIDKSDTKKWINYIIHKLDFVEQAYLYLYIMDYYQELVPSKLNPHTLFDDSITTILLNPYFRDLRDFVWVTLSSLKSKKTEKIKEDGLIPYVIVPSGLNEEEIENYIKNFKPIRMRKLDKIREVYEKNS